MTELWEMCAYCKLKPMSKKGNYCSRACAQKNRKTQFSWERIRRSLSKIDRERGRAVTWQEKRDLYFKKKDGLIPKKEVPDFIPLPIIFKSNDHRSTNGIYRNHSRSHSRKGSSKSWQRF